MESGNSKPTRPTRAYIEDIELLLRKAATETARRNRRVTAHEILHEQLAGLRLEERSQSIERGTS